MNRVKREAHKIFHPEGNLVTFQKNFCTDYETAASIPDPKPIFKILDYGMEKFFQKLAFKKTDALRFATPHHLNNHPTTLHTLNHQNIPTLGEGYARAEVNALFF